jgi:hypothetical protein
VYTTKTVIGVTILKRVLVALLHNMFIRILLRINGHDLSKSWFYCVKCAGVGGPMDSPVLQRRLQQLDAPSAHNHAIAAVTLRMTCS